MSNWGKLPAEIIIKIFKCLDPYDSYLEYQLVNKQWFFASMSVVYKEITIDESFTSAFKNWEKVHNLYNLIAYSSYNVGQYVKSITYWPTDNHHLLGLLIKTCPNVEEFRADYSKQLCQYIISEQKESENKALWRNLRKVVLTQLRHYGNSLYRFLYGFRDSLTRLELLSIPNMHTEDDGAQGNECDLCAYVQDFKKLEYLKIDSDIINSLLNCDHIVLHCSPSLNELHLDIHPTDDKPIIASLSQDQLHTTYNYQYCPHLKKLFIFNYTPQSALLEFMYIKTNL